MSEAQQKPTTDAVDAPSALRSSVDWTMKHWTRVRLGHEGVMLERIQRVQRIGEIAARNAVSGKGDDTSGWPGNEEGDKMGVKIGDEIHHHYALPTPEPTPNKASLLSKVALVAALLYLGAGAVAIPLWLAGNSDREKPAIESPPAVDTDTTRRIEIEVWRRLDAE